MLKIPKVKNCCFCIDLRTGCLILGWLGAVFGPLGFLGSIYDLDVVDDRTRASENLLTRIEALGNTSEPVLRTEKGLKTLIAMEPLLLFTYYFEAIICCVTTVTSIFLLIGVYRDRSNYILQYVYVTIVTMIVGFVYQIVAITMTPSDVRGAFIAGMLTVDIFFLGLDVYFLVAVYSYFDTLRKDGTIPFIRQEL